VVLPVDGFPYPAFRTSLKRLLGLPDEILTGKGPPFLHATLILIGQDIHAQTIDLFEVAAVLRDQWQRV